MEDSQDTATELAKFTNVVRVNDKDNHITALTVPEYFDTASALALLQQRHKDVVYDVATTKGMDAARKSRQELVKLRTALEAKRKELKEPVIERGRALDAEAKVLKEAIEALETPIDLQITLEEKRKQTERETKARLEQERQRALRARITAITHLPMQGIGKPSSEVAKLHGELSVAEARDDWAEFAEEAKQSADAARAQLDVLHASALAAEAAAAEKATQEAEQKRLEDERIAAQKLDDDRVLAIRSMERLPGKLVGANVRDLKLAVTGLLGRHNMMTEERFGPRLHEALEAHMAASNAIEAMLQARVKADEQEAEQARRDNEARQKAEEERQAMEAKQAEEREEREAKERKERQEREAREAEERVARERLQAHAADLLEMLETLVGLCTMRLEPEWGDAQPGFSDQERAEIDRAERLVMRAKGQA
jgi:colicin import membrane protein